MHETDKVEPTRVIITMGFTRNMGNFESLRVDVGLEASQLNNESTSQAFDRVYAFVEQKLEGKFTETEDALRDAGLGDK